MDKDKRLMEASCWKRLTSGETGPCPDRPAMLSKSLIQFPVDGQGCVLTLYGRRNEDNGDLLQKVPGMYC